LHRIAAREHCWYHIDAAYGGGLLISEKHKHVLKGLHLGDSVTIDPHKWFYAPLDCGAILVKDHARLRKSFGMQPRILPNRAIKKMSAINFM
jgi:glutamate/tyrosine decarboxylase-like PLP-dependent enzyme